METHLQQLDEQLLEAERSLKAATQALKKAKDAARDGNVRDLDKLIATASEAAAKFGQTLTKAGRSWSFPVEEHLVTGAYFGELAQAAAAAGLRNVREVDGQLFSYPYILKLDARDRSIRIGKTAHRGLRPSHVVKLLKEAQAKPERDSLGPTLHAVEKAYLQLTAGEEGRAIPLADVHALLTLLPGSSTNYAFIDFVMDLYRLDLNGPHVTKGNRRMDLPASTSTKGGKGHRFVSKSGEEKLYSTIRFKSITSE